MAEMTREQWWQFAQAGTRTGKLATVRRDGRPHVAPIWFVLDERDGHDEIIFNTGANSVKGKSLQRDPRFALCVDDENPPFAFLLLEAEATFSEDPADLVRWATKIASRYMGADQAEAFGKRNAVPGELLVRGRITKVVAQADVAA